MSDILKVNNISKIYQKKKILDNISLELQTGEIVGLFGPNGGGKTTCFNVIIGLVKADSGILMINEKNITELPMYLRARLGLAYLPQDSSIFPNLSVEDNIKAISQICEKDKKLVEKKVDYLLDELSIKHIRKEMAYILSGGQRRRVEIARALASNPKFIMLDEPFAGIDPITVNEVKSLLSYLKEQKIGILITEHNIRDALCITDRAYILYDGIVLLHGLPDEIKKNQKVQNLYLGSIF